MEIKPPLQISLVECDRGRREDWAAAWFVPNPASQGQRNTKAKTGPSAVRFL